MKKNAFIFLSLFLLIFLAPVQEAWTGSSSTLTSDSQFISGYGEYVQIEGSGVDASLKLLNNWTQTSLYPPLPQERRDSPLTYNTLNKEIILFGGRKGETALSDTWSYDPQNEVWKEKNPAPSPPARYGHNLVYLKDGRILLFGGEDSSGKVSNDSWIYISTANLWVKQEFIVSPSSRAFASAVSLGNGSVILFGGILAGTGEYSNETWSYTLGASSWTRLNPGSAPPPRQSAAMAYGEGKIVLFGGKSNTYLQDTQVYDVAENIWQERNPLQPGGYTSLVFDSLNRRFILFGGYDGTSFSAETWFYDLDTNQWKQAAPLNSPDGRYASGAVYVPGLNRFYIFGGGIFISKDNKQTWSYAFRSSGTFTSSYFDARDVPYNYSLTWDSFTFSGFRDESRQVKFRVASSTNNLNWTSFFGPEGRTDLYYIPDADVPMPLWSGHKDQRYLKFMAYFETTQLPDSPRLDAFTIYSNRAPDPPSPSSPANNTGTNDLTPLFVWNNATDPDGDELNYQIQVDSSPGFASPDIDLSGIPTCSTEAAISLFEGRWFWRVKAKDRALPSLWSETYGFSIDTTPPAQVTDLSANIGPENRTAELFWTNPPDVGTQTYKGSYQVKWSSQGEITASQWDLIRDSYTSSLGSIIPNSSVRLVISGLTDATTYYFSLRVADEGGNLSLLSNSVSAFTNAPPSVILSSPTGGENWAKFQEILWDYSDPNPGDTHNFAIYLSTDSGTNYTILVASGLPSGTTSYFWDSRWVANGTTNRIKVLATDKRGLSGEDSSLDFSINNENEPPEISITYPREGDVLSGTTNFRWTYFDPNRADHHDFRIYFSTNSGVDWVEISTISDRSTYLFVSTAYPNGLTYRLRIEVSDSGLPVMVSSTTSGVFKIGNNNYPPGDFSLLSPRKGSYVYPLLIFFQWEEAVDPNGDEVTYTLYYSTSDNFSLAENTKTKENSCTLLPALEEDKYYYWKVKAEDPFGLVTWNTESLKKEDNFFFTASRWRVDSADGLVRVEAPNLLGLPTTGYLRIDKVYASDYLPLLRANQRSVSDSLTRKIYDFAYSIGVYDRVNNPIPADNLRNLKLKILFRYLDANGDDYLDAVNVPLENLRICRLQEEPPGEGLWVTAAYPQNLNRSESNLTGEVSYPNGFYGIKISLLGYAPAPAYLSGAENRPNPFDPRKEKTEIAYVLTEKSKVTIRIYNLVGDLVRVFEDASGEGQTEGYRNRVEWDGKNDSGMLVANGMYLCTIWARPVAGGEERKLNRLIGVVK